MVTMNSKNETTNGVSGEEVPSCSRRNSDNNANTADESKGAIPKTKVLAKNGSSTSIKILKLNNNIEDMPTLNCVVTSSKEMLKINFVKNSGNKLTNSLAHIENNSDILCSKDHGPYEYGLQNPIESELINLPYTPNTNGINDQNGSDLNGFQYKNDSDSSSDENELLSVSDDGCIYTYKADNVADLPSSFFNLEIPPLDMEANEERQGNSSPEMDFLEMDFDPGPSGDTDEYVDSRVKEDLPVNKVPDAKETNKPIEPQPSCSKDFRLEPPVECNKQNNDSAKNSEEYTKIIKQVCVKSASVIQNRSVVKMPWSCNIYERTQTRALPSIRRHHSSKGELLSSSDNSPNSDRDSAWKLFSEMTYEKNCENEVLLWTQQEASVKHISQIAPSSCGATAVLNVLNALRIPLPSTDAMQELVNTRFRANSAPLTEYLLSRSNAGCTHRDIITALYKASEGRLYSRFFSMHPERVVNLTKWLGYWMKQGAVPIATLNLQKSQGKIPDSWHHQMIFGVVDTAVYMTNPLELVEASDLWPQLSSESVLLIKREDVISRWNPQTDFPQLIKVQDIRWRELSVVGQVAKIIRESRREVRLGSTITPHIKIPAEYRSGITLSIDIKSPAYALLKKCPELPFLHTDHALCAL